MNDKIKNITFTRKIFYLLSQMDGINKEKLDKIYSAAGFKPDKDSWYSFISKLLLSIGTLFTIIGIIFFFAYNWRSLHKFIKLGITILLLIIPALITIFSDLNKFHSKLLLLASSIFTGSILAVFGQIYQTGANAFDLFLAWTILITGIVAISKFQPLWLIWLALINITIILFSFQILDDWAFPYILFILFVINSAFLAVFEIFQKKGDPLFKYRWMPRIITIIALTYITIGSVMGITYEFNDKGYLICLITAIPFYCGMFYIYSQKIHDLTSIASSMICIIIMVFTSILKIMDFSSDSFSILFLGGFFVILLTSISIFILIRINRKWKEII